MLMQLYSQLAGKSLFGMNGTNGTENGADSSNSAANATDDKQLDNILYAQLTKNAASSTPSPSDSMNNNDAKEAEAAKTEDTPPRNASERCASVKPAQTKPDGTQNGSPEHKRSAETSSPMDVVECKVGLMKNMLINNAEKVCSSLLSASSSSNVCTILDDFLSQANSEAAAAAAAVDNNNDAKSNVDEEVADDTDETDDDSLTNGPLMAIEHGEHFLKWLESCSIPNITAMQVMQFKSLLNSCKSSALRTATQNAAVNGVPTLASDEQRRSRKRK